VYNDLMVFCVTKFSTVLDKQMGRYDSNKPPNFSSGKWKKLSVIVKSYLSNFIHFVGQLTGMITPRTVASAHGPDQTPR
jgi:hypothetical protein